MAKGACCLQLLTISYLQGTIPNYFKLNTWLYHAKIDNLFPVQDPPGYAMLKRNFYAKLVFRLTIFCNVQELLLISKS